MDATKKVRIAVLVSGGGTNLQAIIDAKNSGIIKSAEIKLVISNKADAFALERAAKAGIKTAVVEKKDCKSQGDFESRLVRLLDKNAIDIIVLAGFMCILSGNFTDYYADRIINVHPSLIPKFCGQGFYGLKVHEAVLAAGEEVTGATVHFVNDIPDGGRIIAQKEVRVMPGDTPETLQKRVMCEAEWIILPAAIEAISQKLLSMK